jgi:tRNA A-37 threonylcarbamoyl transferase component Bud32/2-polyprenyl-3-methyl-5-hydroxy-6-metoxy-1,4-benzoquinol methylase
VNDFDEICRRFPKVNNIIFVSESSLDPSRKTYRYQNLIIKSYKKNEDRTQHLRQNSLQQEYKLLRKCEKVYGVPKAYHYCFNDNYELIFISYLHGIQLSNMRLTFGQQLKVLKELSKILYKLSKYGISHNDIVPENILISNDFKISLIDFDQATETKFLTALLRQFTGIKIGVSKVNFSMITIIKDFLRKKFPKTYYQIKKTAGREVPEINPLPVLNEDASAELKKMLKAWKIAQKSNASSPGIPIAYYALEYNGVHFPGERPWSKRWIELKNISDYSGKTIIELGCNMGLLSTFLMKEFGAKKCIGVDHDEKILESARIIAEVFDVTPVFKVVDFDSSKNWEDDLLSYKADIVFALNVLNWVQDKKRFLKFLSSFNEVIFEGHDLPENEKNNFRQFGFASIEEIGYSERERIILRCRK